MPFGIAAGTFAAAAAAAFIEPEPYRYFRIRIGNRSNAIGSLSWVKLFQNGVDMLPDMTSNTAPSPAVISASHDNMSRPPWQAFNKSMGATDNWAGTVTLGTDLWVKIDVGAGNEFAPDGLEMAIGAHYAYVLYEFWLEGSNDDSAWDIIHYEPSYADWGGAYDTIKSFSWRAPDPKALELIEHVTFNSNSTSTTSVVFNAFTGNRGDHLVVLVASGSNSSAPTLKCNDLRMARRQTINNSGVYVSAFACMSPGGTARFDLDPNGSNNGVNFTLLRFKGGHMREGSQAASNTVNINVAAGDIVAAMSGDYSTTPTVTSFNEPNANVILAPHTDSGGNNNAGVSWEKYASGDASKALSVAAAGAYPRIVGVAVEEQVQPRFENIVSGHTDSPGTTEFTAEASMELPGDTGSYDVFAYVSCGASGGNYPDSVKVDDVVGTTVHSETGNLAYGRLYRWANYSGSKTPTLKIDPGLSPPSQAWTVFVVRNIAASTFDTATSNATGSPNTDLNMKGGGLAIMAASGAGTVLQQPSFDGEDRTPWELLDFRLHSSNAKHHWVAVASHTIEENTVACGPNHFGGNSNRAMLLVSYDQA